MISFFSNDAFVAGSPVLLGADAAQHLRVLRTGVGERVQLRDGKGGAGEGVISRVGKRSVTVDVAECSTIDAPQPVHLMVPVADRDRMLMLAEKCTELGATSWRPVMWRRSRSVGPLGDGPTFQARIFARMTAALTQSGGGWLPETHPSASVSRAIAAAPEGTRLLLDADADVWPGWAAMTSPVVIAIGPEGGLEAKERDEMVEAGFLPVRIARSILRFETAGIAALSVVRCLLEREGDDLV